MYAHLVRRRQSRRGESAIAAAHPYSWKETRWQTKDHPPYDHEYADVWFDWFMSRDTPADLRTREAFYSVEPKHWLHVEWFSVRTVTPALMKIAAALEVTPESLFP